MKKTAVLFCAAMLLIFSSCGESSSKNEGGNQVDEPVMNSGPNTEGERATNAVEDSSNAGRDSTIHNNPDAMSSPH